MNLTQITSADLKQMAKLAERRESLQARIAKLDAQLANFGSREAVAPAPGKPGRKPGRPRKAKRAARGAVKAAIIGLIQGAGKSGITVKEIAANLGVNYRRIFTWFYNTGSTIKEIKKVGPGKYRWTAP